MDGSVQRGNRRALLARIIKPLVVALAVVLVIKTFVLEAYRIPSGSMESTLVPGDFVLVNKMAFGLRTPHEIPILGVRLPAQTLIPGRSVQRGDVVVFSFTKGSPGNHLPPGSKLVKRVIGLPGDTVLIAGSDVRVNGRSLQVPVSSGVSPQRRGPGPHPWFGAAVVPAKGDIVQLSGEDLIRWADLIKAEGHDVDLSSEGTIRVDGKAADTYTIGNDYYYVLGDNLDNSFDSRYWGFVSERELIGEVLMIYWSWHQAPSSEVLSTVSSIRWERIGSLVR